MAVRPTRGRPTKLDELRAQRIVDAVRHGNYRETAAAAAGIGRRTLYEWLSDERPLYREFRERVEAAEAACEPELVASIRTAALEGHVKAAIEFLGRRWPQAGRPRSAWMPTSSCVRRRCSWRPSTASTPTTFVAEAQAILARYDG